MNSEMPENKPENLVHKYDFILKEYFGIDLFTVTKIDDDIILQFFGKAHKSIQFKINPLEYIGSGTITNQDVLDIKIKEFEKIYDEELDEEEE